MKKALFIVFIVLFIDQCVKIWIKTHMFLGQEIHVAGDWFIIHFTENNGMAFGMEIAGHYGKLFLSLFRIVAVMGIGWYLYYIIKQKSNALFVTSMALIFAGALGNIIDSAFYGLIFSSSEYQQAVLFPSGGGYASFLHGRVVDMFYFPLIEGHFPSWFPIWKGESFIFFRPVFNISDAAITVGVFIIILFQSKIFSKKEEITTGNAVPVTEASSSPADTQADSIR